MYHKIGWFILTLTVSNLTMLYADHIYESSPTSTLSIQGLSMIYGLIEQIDLILGLSFHIKFDKMLRNLAWLVIIVTGSLSAHFGINLMKHSLRSGATTKVCIYLILVLVYVKEVWRILRVKEAREERVPWLPKWRNNFMKIFWFLIVACLVSVASSGATGSKVPDEFLVLVVGATLVFFSQFTIWNLYDEDEDDGERELFFDEYFTWEVWKSLFARFIWNETRFFESVKYFISSFFFEFIIIFCTIHNTCFMYFFFTFIWINLLTFFKFYNLPLASFISLI